MNCGGITKDDGFTSAAGAVAAAALESLHKLINFKELINKWFGVDCELTNNSN